ncbi:MAG: ankyrin repeat domain-containing protein, partial [Nevskiaceae bacterium]|nr:ankyrin repeat domain-containing protein [Nevskiaceae bacterium]
MRRQWFTGLCCALLSAGAAASTALIDAIKADDTAAALALIDSRVDVNEAESDGTTPLQWAVYRNNDQLVARLIKARAKVATANDYGATPLAAAADVGNIAILQALLKAGAKADTPNPDGQTPLMMIARTDNVEAARLLLKHGADVNARETWRGQTALMWAAGESQPAMVAELIKAGAKVDERSFVNDWERQVTAEPRFQNRPAGGLTPLIYAARQGCLACAKLLVEAGANVNLADPQGVTPLIVASQNFSFDVASYLLSKGANPNKWDWWGRTPLYMAVDLNTIPHGGRSDLPSLDETTNIELIDQLLKAGANPNLQLKLFPPYRHTFADRGLDGMLTIGTTPLLRAAKAGDVAAVDLMLQHGANPNLPNVQGITPVMAAARLGSGANDTRGRFITPQESIATLKLLLAAGGDVNARNQNGQTALFGAALYGWNEVVTFLANNGAALDVKDANDKTPIDAALGRAGGQGRGA